MFYVLVVEDSPNIRFMVSTLLKEQGCEVTEAANGWEALTILKSNPYFDLIITNIQMPHMNGFQFISQLRWVFPDLAVLVSSAFSEQPALMTIQKSYAYLAKPYSRQQLLDAVAHFKAQ